MIDINTTPLIDVMLVLLVMLIITIPIQTALGQSQHADRQSAAAARRRPRWSRSTSTSTAPILWNGEIIPDRADARGEVHQRRRASRSSRSSTCARTSSSKYKHVAGVMASAQRLGLTKIGLVGSEQFVR